MLSRITGLVLVLAAAGLLPGQVATPAAGSEPPLAAKPRLALRPMTSIPRLDRAWHRKFGCTAGPVQGFVDIPGAWCEGLAVAENGDLYTADSVNAAVYRISPAGTAAVFATLYPWNGYNPDDPYWYVNGPKGMGFSREGDLWICNPNFGDPATHGIWKVDRHGRAVLAIPLDPALVPFPNGLAFDSHGNLYFTESWIGGVWKVERGQSTATLWLGHDLFAPAGGWGANGIAWKDGSIYVANTDQVTVIKIPVQHDGSPGNPAIFGAGFGWPDGLTVGPGGTLYAIGGWEDWQLIRFADDGAWEIVVPSGMTGTSSLAFGKTHGQRNTVFLSNFGSTWTGLPSVLKVELCKPAAKQ